MCNQNLFRAPLQNPKVLKSWKKLDSTIYLAFTFYKKSQFSKDRSYSNILKQGAHEFLICFAKISDNHQKIRISLIELALYTSCLFL